MTTPSSSQDFPAEQSSQKRNGSSAQESSGERAPASAVERASEGSLYCAGEVRILVIDDDEAIGALIKAALEPKGFCVESLADTTRLDEQLRSCQYHLVILDYVLPGVSTEDVIHAIKESQEDTSIVVVTAYPSMDSALSSLRAHAYDYVTKPFSVQQLQEIVTRCLESRGLLRLSEEALRETLGNAVRDRRKTMGLTLAQMAERTGVSLGYLSQIELGRNSASIETLYKISLGLGIRLSDLFRELQVSL